MLHQQSLNLPQQIVGTDWFHQQRLRAVVFPVHIARRIRRQQCGRGIVRCCRAARITWKPASSVSMRESVMTMS